MTSGGDCQALNATMRGIAKALYTMYDTEVEIIGFEDGFRGLIYGDYRKMQKSDFSGILTRGGTLLGTSRTPFKYIDEPDENGLNKVEAMKNTYKKLRLNCLCVLGGNGSLKTANRLSQEGLNVIGLPKTIDNDLWGTDVTFGFQSAVDIATAAIDNIHTTAYDTKKVIEAIRERNKSGKAFSILAVAEGAITKEDAKLGKKELKKKKEKGKVYPSISYELADQIGEALGTEVRVTVPGHTQRGGVPNAYDRVLSTRLGAEAAMCIKRGEFGVMMARTKQKITAVPLADIAGKLKTVDPKSDIIKQAKAVGICFGD